MKFFYPIIIFLGLLFLSSCNDSAPTGNIEITPQDTIPDTIPDYSALYRRWQFMGFIDGSTKEMDLPIALNQTDLIIKSDWRFAGDAVCNFYGGAFTLEGNSFSTFWFGKTLVWCGEERGIREDEYFYRLDQADTFKISNDTLIIDSKTGYSLVYKPKVES